MEIIYRKRNIKKQITDEFKAVYFFSWSWANTTNLFPSITIQPLRLNSV